MEKHEEKNKTFDIIVKIVLIIVIILLLIHNCALLNEKGKIRIPGGNVEIIEIKCDDRNDCKTEPEKGETDDDNKNTGNKEKPGSNTSISVFDNEHSKITWNGASDLKIFTNPVYEFDGIIAPESENTYQFVVKNDTKYKLKYSLSFEETNPYNINMKYKLKKNNTYVIDHYVSYNELKLLGQALNVDKNDTFYLEWKWISTDHDNYAGENGANYTLKINIKAESVND